MGEWTEPCCFPCKAGGPLPLPRESKRLGGNSRTLASDELHASRIRQAGLSLHPARATICPPRDKALAARPLHASAGVPFVRSHPLGSDSVLTRPRALSADEPGATVELSLLPR